MRRFGQHQVMVAPCFGGRGHLRNRGAAIAPGGTDAAIADQVVRQVPACGIGDAGVAFEASQIGAGHIVESGGDHLGRVAVDPVALGLTGAHQLRQSIGREIGHHLDGGPKPPNRLWSGVAPVQQIDGPLKGSDGRGGVSHVRTMPDVTSPGQRFGSLGRDR